MTTIAPPPSRERRRPDEDPSGASRPPRPPVSVAEARSQAVALRRAILLMAGTVLAPGSAQRAAGNRRLGRISLRVWLVTVAVLALLALVASQRPTLLVALGSNDTVLTAGRIALAALGVGWLFLVLDTWRLARPPTLSRRGRLTLTGLTGLVFLLVAGLISTGMHLIDVQRDLVGSVFSKGPAIGAVDGRYNVLVLGGDAGDDREGLRPDSLTVASVDAETGQAVLVGIPRNLMDAPFPEDSPFTEFWPDGFDCGDECIINALYTWATDNAEEFPQYDDPGLEATRQAAEGVTGLSIPYIAIVDMAGFEQIVDALGGVTVDVGKRVPIGALGNIEGYIEPGIQKLDGYQALWFARSREGSSDYERMVRQKCLMSSLARQADPIKVLSNYEALASASAALVTTDIPSSDLPGLMTVARLSQKQPITALSLVPPLVDPARPDFQAMRNLVQKSLEGPAGPEVMGPPSEGSVGAADTVEGPGHQMTTSETPAVQGSRQPSDDGSRTPELTAAEKGLLCQPV